MATFDHTRILALAVASALAACGGGGGDAGTTSAAVTYPASGPYGWILKASGSTTALRYGLSLVHPSKPDTEYVIEVSSAAVTDGRLVSSGSVDGAALKAVSLRPSFLVYIVGGDVRSVPMEANGAAPSTRVQRAGSTSACKFVVDAVDYSAPQNTRYVVSTAGADGQCDTTDDGRAEVKLSAALGVVVSPFAGEPPLDVVRDPVTLAPRGWLFSRSVSLWSTTPATTFATRAASAPAVTRAVLSTYNGALVEDGNQLAVFSFTGGAGVTDTPLGTTLTAGGGWQPIGFDAGNFYVYRNGGTSFLSPYTVLRISRAAPTASVLSSGVGLISLAAMGKDVIYLTVFAPLDNKLVRLSKTGGVASPAITSTPTDTLISVQTSAAGAHQAWRVTGVGSAAPTYQIDIVDESGATLYTAAGGFPLSVLEPSARDFNSSESRTGFLFASGYGARAFGDASLVSYDGTARVARIVGAVPGAAAFGTDFVFATAIGGPTSQGLLFAARSSGGAVQEGGSKVYSFDANAANSLTPTSNIR